MKHSNRRYTKRYLETKWVVLNRINKERNKRNVRTRKFPEKKVLLNSQKKVNYRNSFHLMLNKG